MLASWRGIALALGLGFVLCGVAAADEPDQSQAEPSAQAQAKQSTPARPGQNAAATAPMLDEDALIGLTVRDKMGHVVGEVQNAVVGLPDGYVRYVVVASDALAGDDNDGMLALPWEAFEVKQTNGEPQFAQLRIATKTAAAAPKVLEDQTWPAALPKAFLARVDQEAGAGRAKVGYRGAPPSKGAKTSTWRLYQMEGANVQSSAGEDMGEVENISINSQTGHIEFVTIDSGGFLDLEYDSHALPISALRVAPASEEYEPVFQLAISNKQYAHTPVAGGEATAATIRERVKNFEQTSLRQSAQPQPTAPPAETQPQQ